MKKRELSELIDEAKIIHNGFYDYSRIKDYKGVDAKNEIICPIHGVFQQSFYNHINKRCGCPKCGIEKTKSHNKLPIEVVKTRIISYGYEVPKDFIYVNNNSYQNQQEYKLPNSLLRLDFYLPQYKCAIECQGKQHDEKVFHDFNEILKKLKNNIV